MTSIVPEGAFEKSAFLWVLVLWLVAEDYSQGNRETWGINFLPALYVCYLSPQEFFLTLIL
jgi:hypothetical protein